jgi:hypothetical protein
MATTLPSVTIPRRRRHGLLRRCHDHYAVHHAHPQRHRVPHGRMQSRSSMSTDSEPQFCTKNSFHGSRRLTLGGEGSYRMFTKHGDDFAIGHNTSANDKQKSSTDTGITNDNKRPAQTLAKQTTTKVQHRHWHNNKVQTRLAWNPQKCPDTTGMATANKVKPNYPGSTTTPGRDATLTNMRFRHTASQAILQPRSTARIERDTHRAGQQL